MGVLGSKSPAHVAISLQTGPEATPFARYPGRKPKSLPVTIAAFVGPNGSGKTFGVVCLGVLPAWDAGRLVVSNLALYPERLGFPADLYQPLSSWKDIARIGACPAPEGVACEPGECEHSSTRGRGCLLVLDEASAVLPSRSSASVPAQLIVVLNQLRKRDVTLMWTAPDFARMDIIVRACTQTVTLASGFAPDRWVRDCPPGTSAWLPPRALDEDGQPIPVERGWRPNRGFTFKTYEATSYDEFTLGKTERLRPRSSVTIWRTRHGAMHAYETLEQVALLDHLADTGTCWECGGKKKAEVCRCSTPHRGGPAGSAATRGGDPRAGSSPQTAPPGSPHLSLAGADR